MCGVMSSYSQNRTLNDLEGDKGSINRKTMIAQTGLSDGVCLCRFSCRACVHAAKTTQWNSL